MKAFDTIGNGSFRKHLAKCKEANDKWAVEMYTDVQFVANTVRELQYLVNDIPSVPFKLYDICLDIMSSAQPPIKMFAGVATCVLTNSVCNHCLDFSKVYKGENQVFVHGRFSNFFLFLWFCNKIEYIIRSYVRNWLEQQQANTSFKELCDKAQADLIHIIEKMHILYNLAYKHVQASLKKFILKNSTKQC